MHLLLINSKITSFNYIYSNNEPNEKPKLHSSNKMMENKATAVNSPGKTEHEHLITAINT